jgi:hypothetical protein
MFLFAEWLQKNHGVVIEDLRDRTRGESDPLRRKPAETPEQEAEKRKEDREKKKILQARTRGHGSDLYSRLRGK